MIINGTTAIYYETYYGEKGVIWDIGDYIIELAATGFSEDELISMTEFVEKVEKSVLLKNNVHFCEFPTLYIYRA